MLAGEPPFTGPRAESIVRQHLAAAPPRVSAMRAAVPPAIEEAIARALAKTPADRFATAAEFAGALAAPAPRVRGTGRRASRLAVGAGLAATLLAAAAGLFVLSRLHGTPALPGGTGQSIAVLPFVNVSGAPRRNNRAAASAKSSSTRPRSCPSSRAWPGPPRSHSRGRTRTVGRSGRRFRLPPG